MFGCGDSLLSAYISLKLLTYRHLNETLKRTTYLFDVEEVGLHTLDCNLLVALDGLGLEHFRKGTFSLLLNQSILYKIIGLESVEHIEA
jgi:hypothetical protein